MAVRSTSAKFADASESEMSTNTELPALTDAELTVAVGGTPSAGLTAALASEVAGDPLLNVAVTVNV